VNSQQFEFLSASQNKVSFFSQRAQYTLKFFCHSQSFATRDPGW